MGPWAWGCVCLLNPKAFQDFLVTFEAKKNGWDAQRMESAIATFAADSGQFVPLACHVLYFREHALDLARLVMLNEFVAFIIDSPGSYKDLHLKHISDTRMADIMEDIIGDALKELCKQCKSEGGYKQAESIGTLAMRLCDSDTNLDTVHVEDLKLVGRCLSDDACPDATQRATSINILQDFAAWGRQSTTVATRHKSTQNISRAARLQTSVELRIT